MEELREAARYYRGTASDEYKQRALKALDKGESLEDFYIRETERSIRRCDVCAKLLVGFYLCCTKCELYKGYNYNLCVECFYGGTFQHEHDCFADNHSVLMMHNRGRTEPSCLIEKKPKGKGLQQPPVKVQQTKELDKGKGKHDFQIVAKQCYTRSPVETKISAPSYLSNSNLSNNIRHLSAIKEGRTMVDKQGMEKLGRIANAHYKAASKEIKDAANEFCQSMFQHTGRNNSLCLSENEFLLVMKEKGYPQYADKDLFNMLAAKDNNHVTMSGALTLYYILLSGRPFCSGCEQFIPDIFFCCSKCPAAKYALCLDCYEKGEYVRHKRNKHFGENDVFFLDYTVLHTSCSSATPTPAQSQYLQIYEPKPESTNNAIVKKAKRTEIVTTFSAVLTTCTAALNFATAFCTIM